MMSSATSRSSLPSGLAVLTTFPDVLFIPELVSASFPPPGRAEAARGAPSMLGAASIPGMGLTQKCMVWKPGQVPKL